MAGLPHIYPSPGDGIEELPAPASDTAPGTYIDGPAVPIATDPATGEPVPFGTTLAPDGTVTPPAA